MNRSQASIVSPGAQQSFPPDVPYLVRKVLWPTTRLRAGALTIVLPDGRKVLFDSGAAGPRGELVIKDYNFARRLLVSGEIGFGEAYLQGEWESPRLEALIELMSVNRAVIDEVMPGRFMQRMLQLLAHTLNRNTRSGARQNIRAHYDLGNAFYQSWLDQTMTYSSAVFAPGDNDLAAAQARKYRLLAERAGVRPGEHVLEIGCGWGGFAEFAGRELGCKVTGLTISQEQFDFATERMRKAGLADRVTIALRDYRDESGVFDRIVSIEMFEAVGEGFWPAFFRQLRERLRPGGTAGLQVITIAEWLWPSYRREVDFIRRYIFPGGMLPTASIMRGLGEKYGVPMLNEWAFRQDYAATLAQWRERFLAAWPKLKPLGFDERFRRMWEYYLSYCEGGFRGGSIDVRQMVFARPE
ncbi:MAG: class I SAM-dependent methyltransferase [Hyphomicrobiales bacterium]|nr:class I SAM-dependent methyltransferase [Hyphomicrobiales bacterium]MBV9433722.1 class I SAM-dependent methyltransferase [Hyphomicrobiales bacterium]MBV9739500.1 class I SAM-dependent methyltransferase [Hyphomicrobiales bacterium]MBW0002415.1 class I SAM-dependent methyltransferase [Hyphomicrobiales bacterium]